MSNDSVVLSTRVSKELRSALEERAREERISVSELVRASLPMVEQLAKSDVHPAPTRDPVPRGEAHEKTENLVGKDLSKQGIPIPPSDNHIDEARARARAQ